MVGEIGTLPRKLAENFQAWRNPKKPKAPSIPVVPGTATEPAASTVPAPKEQGKVEAPTPPKLTKEQRVFYNEQGAPGLRLMFEAAGDNNTFPDDKNSVVKDLGVNATDTEVAAEIGMRMAYNQIAPVVLNRQSTDNQRAVATRNLFYFLDGTSQYGSTTPDTKGVTPRDKAKQAKNQLAQYTKVGHAENGKTYFVSYEKWQQIVEARAIERFGQETWDKASPRHRQRLKIQVDDGFYTQDLSKFPAETKPKPPVKEAVELKDRVANTQNAAETVLLDLLGAGVDANGKVVMRDINEAEIMKMQQDVQDIFFLYGRLTDPNPDKRMNKEVLAALLTRSLRKYTDNNTNLKKEIKEKVDPLISSNEAHYDHKGAENDPVRNLLKNELNKQGHEDAQALEILKNCDSTELYMFSAGLYPALKVDEQKGSHHTHDVIEKAITSLHLKHTTGRVLNILADRGSLHAFSETCVDNLGARRVFDKGIVDGLPIVKWLGDKPKDLRDLMKSDLSRVLLHWKHKNKISDLSPKNRTIIEQVIALDDTQIAKFVNESGYGKILLILYGIQLLQGLLGFGTDESGGGGGAH